MTTSQHTSSFTTDGPCRYAFQASHPQEATDRLAGMHGAEGATGSSLGQAKRSPRSQATYGIGPEGTEERRSRVPSLQDGHVGGFYPGAALRLPQATSYRASGACCAHYASQITVSTGAMFQTGQLSESKHTTGTQSSRRNNGLGGYNVQQAEWQASRTTRRRRDRLCRARSGCSGGMSRGGPLHPHHPYSRPGTGRRRIARPATQQASRR